MTIKLSYHLLPLIITLFFIIFGFIASGFKLKKELNNLSMALFFLAVIVGFVSIVYYFCLLISYIFSFVKIEFY
jgi:hypothetical protein